MIVPQKAWVIGFGLCMVYEVLRIESGDLCMVGKSSDG